MYHHLRGDLIEAGPTHLVIDVGGVGYELRAPLSTSEVLRGKREVQVFTRLVSREDQVRLYGFATAAERELFDLVLSVSGVGPAIALAALSCLSVDELLSALSAGDVSTVRRIKGVGKKLAERLIVELKDRVGTLARDRRLAGARPAELPGREPEDPGRDPRLEDAALALVELGFQRKVALEKVQSTYRALSEGRPPAEARSISVEEIIREALRRS